MNEEKQTTETTETTETNTTPTTGEDTTPTVIVDDPTTASMLDSFIVADDVVLILGLLLIISSLGLIVSRLIIFVPEFTLSMVRKVRNKSIVYSDDTLHNPKLDQSELGIKSLIDRSFL